MIVNDIIFWMNASVVANIYLFLFFVRRWPQLRFTAYVLNLIGLSACGFSLILAMPNLSWTGGFLLNLTFQNVLIAHPKWTGKSE